MKSPPRPKRSCGWSTTASWRLTRSAWSRAVWNPTARSSGTALPNIAYRLPAGLKNRWCPFPLAKAVILLLNLPAKDFLRSQVIDLLSSPYFQLQKLAAEPTNARPDLWDLATRELAICKGVSEWRRLRRFTQRDLLLRQISDDDETRVIQITTAQLLSLADVVDALVADLAGLPNQASWQEYSTRWKALLEKYLGIASMDETGTAASVVEPSDPRRPRRARRPRQDRQTMSASAISATPLSTGSNAPR